MRSNVYIFTHAARFEGQKPDQYIIKVGKANDVGTRYRAANTWAPYGITVLHAYSYPSPEVAASREAYIHKKYKRYATSSGGSEWFKVPTHVLAEIDSILAGRGEFSVRYKIRLWRQRTTVKLKRFWKHIRNSRQRLSFRGDSPKAETR